MSIHGALSESSVSDRPVTHDRKGREGKGREQEGSCCRDSQHQTTVCTRPLGRGLTWLLVLAGLSDDNRPPRSKPLPPRRALALVAPDMSKLQGWFDKGMIREDDAGCWIWHGARFRNGYGAAGLNRSTRSAHRVVYELMVCEVPRCLDLDHLCRVRACVNPEHLEPVTRSMNLVRGAHPTQGRLGRGAA